MIQIHETDKHKIVAVEVPREADFRISHSKTLGMQPLKDGYYFVYSIFQEFGSIFLSESKPEILGTIGAGENTISEEQASEIVAPPNKDGIFLGLDEYHNYSDNDLLCCTTALESLETLMESKGLLLENPLGEGPKRNQIFVNEGEMEGDIGFATAEEYEYCLKQWQQAEKDLKKYLIIKLEK